MTTVLVILSGAKNPRILLLSLLLHVLLETSAKFSLL
jgi:hypothetical protein